MFVLAITGLARSKGAPIVDLVLQARLADAGARTAVLVEQERRGGDGATVAELAMLAGDLKLAQDHDAEAEELYQLAMKSACAGPRGLVRVISCRNTGMMSLYQQRYASAASCFQRVIFDTAATVAQRVEAMCGLAAVQHGTGQPGLAQQTLQGAADLARGHDERLPLLVALVRCELLAQQAVRCQPALRDHVFWQVATAAGVTPGTAVRSALEAIGELADAQQGHVLIAQRLRHLQTLVHAAEGDRAALAGLHAHLGWLRQAGLAAVERCGRLDTALVALAASNADLARASIEPLSARSTAAQRWGFELSYCLAKLCEMTGRPADSLKHYQRYALETLQCVRVECVTEPAQAGAPKDGAAKDDVEMRLPAKYRRAYRYLIGNLDRATLSVREIAEHVGVTERALQTVFRSHVGMTPAEVVRRCRVERIREELLAGHCTGRTILEAGARWGISNRSTLVASYRRHFDETPAETVLRGDGPAPRRAAVVVEVAA